MKAISLFSGCGGFEVAASNAGFDLVFSNDILPDATKTLALNYEHTVACGDIKEIPSFPSADIVIGGYPCQSFSMGGNRDPEKDQRTYLYREFARCVNEVSPKFFVAENVSGLKSLKSGSFLDVQLKEFATLGKHGYHISYKVVNARDYGVPQSRKRLLIVGCRKDLGVVYEFPSPTHGKLKINGRWHKLLPFESHGEAIKDLPLHPKGEFYERPHDPEGNFSWYYMSRNRKAPWHEPAFTVVANWRHVTLHPASPTMTLTWSNLADGWKQRWDFSGEYEHTSIDPSLPTLEFPRRLSWEECSRIQTFPADYHFFGNTESKYLQVGNAVPPLLGEKILNGLIDQSCLVALTPENICKLSSIDSESSFADQCELPLGAEHIQYLAS